jgi:hypothetical protein
MLMTELGSGDGQQGSTLSLVCPPNRMCPLDGGLSSYNTDSLTVDHIVGNMFGQCHAHCSAKFTIVLRWA